MDGLFLFFLFDDSCWGDSLSFVVFLLFVGSMEKKEDILPAILAADKNVNNELDGFQLFIKLQCIEKARSINETQSTDLCC